MSNPSVYRDPPGVNSKAVGDSFEDFVAGRHGLVRIYGREIQLAHGDARSGEIYHEIKHDPHSRWGHLMIEVAANNTGASGWNPGGIFSGSDAHYYWHGDEKQYWRFAKQDLVDWAAAREITPEVVMRQLRGEILTRRLIAFQGTMLRFQVEYAEADEIGCRFVVREIARPKISEGG
jgi:hypothetical protein